MEANRQEALQRKAAFMKRKRQEAEDTGMCTVAEAWSQVHFEAEQPEDDAWMLSAESWRPVEKGEHKLKPMLMFVSDAGEAGDEQPAKDHHSDDVTEDFDGEEHNDDDDAIEQMGGGNIKQIGFAQNDANEHGEPDSKWDMAEFNSDHLNVERINRRASPSGVLSLTTTTSRPMDWKTFQRIENSMSLWLFYSTFIIMFWQMLPTMICRIVFEGSTLERPIWCPPTMKSQLSIERWMAEVERVLMSHEQFTLADNFSVRVERAKLVGAGCIPGDSDLISQQVKSFRCVFQFKNEDNLCLARALVVAKAHADIDESTPELRKESMRVYKNLGRATGPMRGSQKKAALELVRLAGITDIKDPYTLADLPKFEAVLLGYQITVLSFTNGKGIIFKSEATGKPLMLLQRNNHFDVCTSIAPFFGRSYWCHNCEKGYNQRILHRCQFMCQICLRQDCPKEMDSLIFCTSCLREFPGQSYFDPHLAMKAAGSKNNGTEISKTFCKNCKIHVIPGDHQCYIMPINFSQAQRKKHRETEFLYFDLETFTSADGLLIPDLAIVQNGFGECVYFPKSNEPIGRDISDELCKFLISPQFQNSLELKDVSKGDFPHRFDRSENWSRVTPFPSKDDFGYRGLSAKDKTYFDQCWQGCPICFNKDTIHPIRQILYDNVYQDTKERTQYLRDQGYDVEEVGEHDFKRMLKDNKEMQIYIKIPCTHSKDQRKLIGTWCTPEILKALEKGYVVDEIKEVWHFPEQRLGLFVPYIDPFYKIKTESSGYPAEVVTEDEKDK
ncbi:hypothetical protein BV898_06549 [Hypsibius exemplaris]|uniref:DNA-directed DNA polymerase n=1 Tax=Hypsibius exemplaris TaxID=2072580 RepID=A0A1W0WW63_HYPEX|nr:hypothetical protein BV898_06549 [Hypsibius exemplaris]